MIYQEVNGDLISLAQAAEFDVIAHGCNCFCQMGAGIAPLMHRAFQCNDPHKYSWESNQHKGDINKLGNIQSYAWYMPLKGSRKRLDVVNAYTQYHYGTKFGTPLSLEALTLCLRKINTIFKGKHIGLPLIGCGLAGGLWDLESSLPHKNDREYNDYYAQLQDQVFVKDIIQRELKDMDVTIVHYKP